MIEDGCGTDRAGSEEYGQKVKRLRVGNRRKRWEQL